MYPTYKSIFPLVSVFLLVACGGGGGGGGDSASNGGGYGTTPTNAAPTINNSTNDYSTIEGNTSGFMVNASDPDGNALTYSIGGNDGAKMTVSSSGVVTFVSAPDYDTPGDANGDNIYSFNVTVSDGTLSAAEGFTITITNDTSDDNADTFVAWDGVLLKNDTFKPYDKHATSYNLIIGGLPDVTDGFVTNVANIANKMLAKNDATNSVNRNLLLNNFTQYKAFQRVGSTNMSSYDPALNNDNYDGWDNINDNYAVVDFIWETTSKSVASTIAVSVAANNAGSGNVYVINGVQKSSLTLVVGKTYTFTHPAGHPLKFSTTSNGTWAGGSEYTTGVTTTSGSTVIEVTSSTPTTLYYYCSLHSGMGGTITVSASSDLEGTKAGQINAILEHLLHTITFIFDKSYTSWGYEDASSDLVLAMNQAIDGGYYDPTGNYGNTQEANPTLYKRVIAQEFGYWVILTGWDLKALYAPDVAPEWTILTASEMETKLPLAHKLFTDTVNGVLVNPTQVYLDGLTFSSLPTASTTAAVPATPTSMAVTIAVSVAANNAGSGNVYVIEGAQKKSLTLEVGKTYTFTHPTGHPLRFSTTSDGTHSSGSGYTADGSEYTTGVTTSTSGSTVIEVTSSTPTTLYYFCSVHSGMGGTMTVSS